MDWGEDFARVSREAELVKTYLSIQKYRFGDRLSYEIDTCYRHFLLFYPVFINNPYQRIDSFRHPVITVHKASYFIIPIIGLDFCPCIS